MAYPRICLVCAKPVESARYSIRQKFPRCECLDAAGPEAKMRLLLRCTEATTMNCFSPFQIADRTGFRAPFREFPSPRLARSRGSERFFSSTNLGARCSYAIAVGTHSAKRHKHLK